MSEIISKIQAITDAFSSNNEAINDNFKAVYDRLERIECSGDRPRGGVANPAATYVEYQTDSGPIYELPSHVKAASVPALRGAKTAPVSLARWMRATVAGDACDDRPAVEFAREQKQLLTTTGGVLIPQVYQPEWVDLLRAQSVLNRAGMRTLVMEAKTANLSAVASDPTVSWHTEGDTVNVGNPTFVGRSLIAKTLVARCQASMELAQDSPEFGQQLLNVMTKALAAEIDRCGLEGSGTPPQPRGIKNTSGRASTTGIGALADYSKVVGGIGKLLAANGDLAQISKFAIMSPGSWAAFQNLVTGITSDKTPLRRPEAIADMQFLATSNVGGSLVTSPQSVTTVFLGDFRDLLLGVRMESSIEILKLSTYATNLLLEFIGYARVDFCVTRPASFCTLEGVLA